MPLLPGLLQFLSLRISFSTSYGNMLSGCYPYTMSRSQGKFTWAALGYLSLNSLIRLSPLRKTGSSLLYAFCSMQKAFAIAQLCTSFITLPTITLSSCNSLLGLGTYGKVGFLNLDRNVLRKFKFGSPFSSVTFYSCLIRKFIFSLLNIVFLWESCYIPLISNVFSGFISI